MSDKNFIWELREAARTDIDPNVRAALKDCADDLAKAVAEFAINATTANMIHLQGKWARAVKVLKLHKTAPDPIPPTQAAVNYSGIRGH